MLTARFRCAPIILLGFALAAATPTGYCAESDAGRVLDLDQALARVLASNPRLAAFGDSIRAADARRTQAALRPNPELGLELEEIRFGDSASASSATRAGDGSLLERSITETNNAGFGESEITLGVSQLIELGGKRARRIELADRDQQVARWEYEIARSEIILETRRAYVEILAGQERTRQREGLLELAQAAASAVEAQVTAGKLTPLLANRAQVEISQARIQSTAAQRNLDAARYRLAMLWGAMEPDFTKVTGDFYVQPAIPTGVELERRVMDSPDLMRWTSELARREAVVILERAARAPDLTVALGWRAIGLPSSSTSSFDPSGTLSSTEREEFDNNFDHSVVIGLSIPLPLFNRNQGNIREAEILVDKGSRERRDTLLTIISQLTSLRKAMEAMQMEVDELEQNILPTATATFEATQVGFDQGKFSYLDVLDTQRTLFEARNQHIDALAGLHQAVAEAERFLGESLGEDGAGNGKRL